MEEKDYLGLSLTLLPPSSSPSPQPSSSSCNHRPPQWPHLLLPHAGIDVNQTPPSARNSEASPPLSPREISSSSAKRTSGAVSDEEEDGDGDGGRKKLRLSKEQSAVLEESFKEHSTLNPKQKLALAKRLHLRPRQVEVWFQNRRARTKLKQTEVDCELLRRCCHDLTEENRRLQKEVQELRALKLSPQFYMHMTPPTTLTLCPSCERISSAATPTPSSKNPPLRPAAEQHQFLLHHRRSGAAAPWSPIPLRPSYLDAPPQRS